MRTRIELNEKDLIDLVHAYLAEQLGPAFDPTKDAIEIQVKSKQNYKSEWEKAEFRAVYERAQ